MKDKELKNKIINWFKAQANNADHQTLDNILDQALKAKEEEVVEGVEKMMPGDKEVNFEENNEAGIKRKVLFEILATLKGKKK